MCFENVRRSRKFFQRVTNFDFFVVVVVVVVLVDERREDPNTTIRGPTLNAGLVAF